MKPIVVFLWCVGVTLGDDRALLGRLVAGGDMSDIGMEDLDVLFG